MSLSFEPRIVVRPRSLDETVDLTVAYLREHLRDFAPAFFWVTLFSLLPPLLGRSLFDLSLGQSAAMLLVSGATVERIVTQYGSRHLFGTKTSFIAATLQTLRHLPSGLITSSSANLPWILIILDIDNDADNDVLTMFGVLLGLVWPLMIAPHFYLRELSMLEHLSARESFKRSRFLIWIRFERIFAILPLTVLIRLATAMLAYSWVRFTTEFVLQFSYVSERFLAVAFGAGWVIAGQFLAVFRLFDYVDARTRREGWDIQVRFDAIRQREENAQARRITV
ncbi:MAG: hypothetical protein AAF449_12685 [Myxococcota bacterium]